MSPSLAVPLSSTSWVAERLAEGLPASARAAIAWFPVEGRRRVVDALRRSPPGALGQAIEEVHRDATSLLFRLAHIGARFLTDSTMRPAIASALADARAAAHARIDARLEPLDGVAASHLHEACEWIGAIGVALESARILDALAARGAREITNAEVEHELRAPTGAVIRGVVLTIAAVDALFDERELPATLPRWCDVAAREIQAAANVLRADGVDVATRVEVPGYTPAEWAQRWRLRTPSALAPSLLPPGVREALASLRPDAVWLFGSRARGTHGPQSDWDLLVVVPDGSHDPDAAVLTALRRRRVDVTIVPRREFDEGRAIFGTLANVAVSEGFRIDAV